MNSVLAARAISNLLTDDDRPCHARSKRSSGSGIDVDFDVLWGKARRERGEDKAAANLPTSIRPSEQSGYISEEEEAEKARIVCTWRRIG